jgi:hypothetical protein
VSDPKAKRNTSTHAQPQSPGLRERLSGLPPWLSALAALFGTLLAAAVAFGWLTHPTSPPSSVSDPRVTLESVLTSPVDITGSGSFADIDPITQEVLFVGRSAAAATTDSWLSIEATMDASSTSGALQSGHWRAVRPSPPAEPFRWYAILWPTSAAANGTDDLRRNGPSSQFVVATSTEIDTP